MKDIVQNENCFSNDESLLDMYLFEKVYITKHKQMCHALAYGPKKNYNFNVKVETVVKEQNKDSSKGPITYESYVSISDSCTSYVHILNENEIEKLKEKQYEKIMNSINFEGLYI